MRATQPASFAYLVQSFRPRAAASHLHPMTMGFRGVRFQRENSLGYEMRNANTSDTARWQVSALPASRCFCVASLLLFLRALCPLTIPSAEPPAPPKLSSDTLAAFDRYVQLTDARNDEELRPGAPFFWTDALPEAQRASAYADLQRGAVKMRRLETRDAGRAIACPHGMIHHWVGLIFIPGVTLEDTLSLLHDYDHHATVYSPDVERSRLESRDGDHYRVFLRFRRHKIVTVVLNTEHDVRYFRDSATRAHSRSTAVRIAQVENAGSRDEREKPPGDDGGFLWRMETWWRMEERDAGTYVQSESVSLTRDIPAGLGWLIRPFVTSIPRESLTFTLEATRRGVQARRRTAAGAN